ncbi:MAG: 2-oxoglutarate dehydrogenase complex dihydrolipoyllysine-residue succinyltransferase [Cytophagales bacterium]|nr:MAG: 2-oxoglutarate dehydrogenase complex dihydrolipoyllysine-residue succinyltransferase [Cytophagales bacterium]
MSIIEMKVPTVGESISEVTIANWLKKDGDFVKIDEVICELESDKATFELAAEKSGTLTIVGQSGDTLSIGALICKIDTAGVGSSAAPVAPVQSATAAAQVSSKDSYASGTPSPAAGKILAEKGIDIAAIKGSGVDGRITKEDANSASKPAPTAPSSAPIKPNPTPTGAREQRREKMTPLRKTISKRLVAVKNETAMLTTFNEVDMKPIMDLRSKYKDMFKEKHGIGLGFMSFFTKACTVALQEFPSVNAFIDGEELVFNSFCDISIAVSAPKGLVVPIIRNAEKMSFHQIEAEISGLAKQARDNKLTIDQMTGGTFTITNGGVFGSMLSTPIINAPQSAILGMHNIVERPMAVNGEVVIRPIMYVALSYDHRIIDGRESVGFLVRVKQLLEDPARLLLQV